MIVDRPQFDLSVVKKGDVYWLKEKHYSRYGSINCPCMIRRVHQFELAVHFFKDDNFKDVVITIDEVIQGEFTLDKMGVK